MTKQELEKSQLDEIEKNELIQYMNHKHADSVLNYAIVYGGILNASSGTLLDLTPYGMAIEYELEESRNICRVTFESPVKDKSKYQEILLSMAKQATALIKN